MSDTPIDATWWLASDGKWYPPTSHPNYLPPSRPDPPAPPSADPPVVPGPNVIGIPGSGPAEVVDRWQKGVDGERATADELMKLPTTFHIIHGLKKGPGRGDIDHLVIGPTGVWVIDSKNDAGELTAGKGTLWNGRYPITNKVEAVEAQARYAREVLGADTNPVLCFVQAKLPRPAQMVGRVRVLELGSLSEHIMAGQVTMLPEHVQAAVERVGDWLRRPPATGSATPGSSRRPAGSSSLAPPPMPSAIVRNRRSPLVSLVAGLLVLALLVGACSLAIAAFTTASRNLASSSDTTTTTLVGPGYLAVQVDCPAPNGGHRLNPRVRNSPSGPIRVSAIVDGTPQYLGEFVNGQPLPPIEGMAPATTVGFDVQLVDAVGQGGPSYRVDVTTPATPC